MKQNFLFFSLKMKYDFGGVIQPMYQIKCYLNEGKKSIKTVTQK